MRKVHLRIVSALLVCMLVLSALVSVSATLVPQSTLTIAKDSKGILHWEMTNKQFVASYNSFAATNDKKLKIPKYKTKTSFTYAIQEPLVLAVDDAGNGLVKKVSVSLYMVDSADDSATLFTGALKSIASTMLRGNKKNHDSLMAAIASNAADLGSNMKITKSIGSVTFGLINLGNKFLVFEAYPNSDNFSDNSDEEVFDIPEDDDVVYEVPEDDDVVAATYAPAATRTATPTATPTLRPTATPTPTPKPTPTPTPQPSSNNLDTVWVTTSGNGTAYHRSSCSTLSRSNTKSLSRSDAEASGFSACKRCKP